MDEKKDELTKMVSLWQTGYFLGQALLEDYAERMAKLDGSNSKDIIASINAVTEKKFEEYKAKNLKK